MSNASSLGKSLPSLAWPLVISFTARAVLTSVDIPYGSMIGDAAVAAIGLFFPLEFLFIACWVGVSSALTSHLSRAMGERHEGRMSQLVRTTAWLAGALALLFLVMAGAVYLVADRLGLDPEVAHHFRIYAPVALAGIAISGFWSTIPDSIIKAHHDTLSTMTAGLISGVANVVLNTLFVLGFGWGIFGIALATGLSRVASLAYALYRARRLEEARRSAWAAAPPTPPRPPGATPDPAFTPDGRFRRPGRALLVLAIPSTLTFALMSTENFLVNAVLSRFEDSTAAIATYAIYHRASLLALMPIVALGVAVLPFVARGVGERRHDEVRRGLRQAFLLSGAYLLLIAAPVCLLAGPPIAAALTKGPAAQELTAFAIRWGVPLATLATAPFILCRPAFEALQRGSPGLIMAAVRYLVFSIPLALGGAALAPRLGHEPFLGLLAGLILGTGLVSITFVAWLARTVRHLGPPEEAKTP